MGFASLGAFLSILSISVVLAHSLKIKYATMMECIKNLNTITVLLGLAKAKKKSLATNAVTKRIHCLMPIYSIDQIVNNCIIHSQLILVKERPSETQTPSQKSTYFSCPWPC